MTMNGPRRVVRRVIATSRRLRARSNGLVYARPGYWHKPLTRGAVVVDCGTGDNADFSQFLIERYGVRAIGVDPTRKHRGSLARLVRRSEGAFVHVERAVATAAGPMAFFESTTNVSGSLYDDHVNVQRDGILAYMVEGITVEGLLEDIGAAHVDLLKLDIEGGEYDMLDALAPATLDRIGQLVVEFHHFCVPRFTEHDTRRIVAKLQAAGFASFSENDSVFVFFRQP